MVHRDAHPPQYLLRGNQLVFYNKQVTSSMEKMCERTMTNLWTDISWEGIANGGAVTYKTEETRVTDSPRQYLYRAWRLGPGRLLGSGTTAATAHKMKRADWH